MGTGVVLDTSYLITLANPTRDHHKTARRYWRHFMESEMPVFLPTIVVSEFYLRQEIPPEILRCCVALPFNWDDARKAAELGFDQFKGQAESRTALKDDIKIIAQAAVCGAGYLITDDTQTMQHCCEALRTAGKVQFAVITLAEGFDRAFFEKGQGALNGLLDETGPEEEE